MAVAGLKRVRWTSDVYSWYPGDVLQQRREGGSWCPIRFVWSGQNVVSIAAAVELVKCRPGEYRIVSRLGTVRLQLLPAGR
jgi:hypothetical protein